MVLILQQKIEIISHLQPSHIFYFTQHVFIMGNGNTKLLTEQYEHKTKPKSGYGFIREHVIGMNSKYGSTKVRCGLACYANQALAVDRSLCKVMDSSFEEANKVGLPITILLNGVPYGRYRLRDGRIYITHKVNVEGMKFVTFRCIEIKGLYFSSNTNLVLGVHNEENLFEKGCYEFITIKHSKRAICSNVDSKYYNINRDNFHKYQFIRYYHNRYSDSTKLYSLYTDGNGKWKILGEVTPSVSYNKNTKIGKFYRNGYCDDDNDSDAGPSSTYKLPISKDTIKS